jgi:hypothetical protein
MDEAMPGLYTTTVHLEYVSGYLVRGVVSFKTPDTWYKSKAQPAPEHDNVSPPSSRRT